MNIGIAGVGGIGSNVALNLVRSGIDRLTLVDFDRVEPSNLNRQSTSRTRSAASRWRPWPRTCAASATDCAS